MLGIWENLFSSVPRLSPCLGLLITGMQGQAVTITEGLTWVQEEGWHLLRHVLGAVSGDSTWPCSLVPLAFGTCAFPHVEHAHLSPPLYLRDDGKSKGSGARLADSSTASINDSYVSLPRGHNHASVPQVQDRIIEDLIKRLLWGLHVGYKAPVRAPASGWALWLWERLEGCYHHHHCYSLAMIPPRPSGLLLDASLGSVSWPFKPGWAVPLSPLLWHSSLCSCISLPHWIRIAVWILFTAVSHVRHLAFFVWIQELISLILIWLPDKRYYYVTT